MTPLWLALNILEIYPYLIPTLCLTTMIDTSRQSITIEKKTICESRQYWLPFT